MCKRKTSVPVAGWLPLVVLIGLGLLVLTEARYRSEDDYSVLRHQHRHHRHHRRERDRDRDHEREYGYVHVHGHGHEHEHGHVHEHEHGQGHGYGYGHEHGHGHGHGHGHEHGHGHGYGSKFDASNGIRAKFHRASNRRHSLGRSEVNYYGVEYGDEAKKEESSEDEREQREEEEAEEAETEEEEEEEEEEGEGGKVSGQFRGRHEPPHRRKYLRKRKNQFDYKWSQSRHNPITSRRYHSSLSSSSSSEVQAAPPYEDTYALPRARKPKEFWSAKTLQEYPRFRNDDVYDYEDESDSVDDYFNERGDEKEKRKRERSKGDGGGGGSRMQEREDDNERIDNEEEDEEEEDKEEEKDYDYNGFEKYDNEEYGSRWRNLKRGKNWRQDKWRNRSSREESVAMGRAPRRGHRHNSRDFDRSAARSNWKKVNDAGSYRFVTSRGERIATGTNHEDRYESREMDLKEGRIWRETDSDDNDDVDDDEGRYDENVEADEEEEDEGEEEEEDEDYENEEEKEKEQVETDSNEFYKKSKKSHLTYDDIIRKLTFDDVKRKKESDNKSSKKRDYRNTEIERYLKRDAYGNLKYEPRNSSRSSLNHYSKMIGSSSSSSSSSSVSSSSTSSNSKSSSYSRSSSGSSSNSSSSSSSSIPHGQAINVMDKRNETDSGKMARKKDISERSRNVEGDYEEYTGQESEKKNGKEEEEEDLVKAGMEEDFNMQADVRNMDYEEEDETLQEEEPLTTTPTPTTTTTTTTTAKSLLGQHHRTIAYNGGYQSKGGGDYPPMSAHSMHKWQSLGTREGVKETREQMQRYNKNGKTAEIREALQHAIKVSKEGSCQWPRARVIPVREVYPSPSTTYIPRCAILHRCSDDTGCCRSEALTCVPKHSQRVELYFYTTSVGGPSVVEKLSFYNHTECECRERVENDSSSSFSSSSPSSFSTSFRHFQPPINQPQNIRRASNFGKSCKCPSEFTLRISPDGECQCNCFENDQGCVKTRRGKGYFSLRDRLCIQSGECSTPTCEFGEYMKRQGKCPRKKDKFDAIANYRTSLNQRYGGAT